MLDAMKCSRMRSRMLDTLVNPYCPGRVSIGLFAWCAAILLAGSRGVLAQPGPTMLLVEQVQKREVPVTLELVGSVEPATRSLIASELAGLVEQIDVEEGDKVEKGAVLCKLRQTTRKLLYEQAEGRHAELKALLEELKAGTRKEEIDRAQATMEEAKALADKWQEEKKRVVRLREGNSASLKEYNDTLADALAAQQRYAQTKAAYELAVAGPRKEEIARAEFAVEAQTALLAKLKYDLDQTSITAPFAGYITHKHAERGQWMTAGGPVVELIDLEKVHVKVDVPESAIAACKVGERVSVFVESLQQTFRGQIGYVIPQADPRARTFPIEVVLDNDSRRIMSGMFVRARVPAGPTEESLVVPRDAVLQRQKVSVVVAVVPSPTGEGQMGMPIPVQLGAEAEDWVAVRAPNLAPGMPVAVKGHDRIYGPQPVQSMPTESTPSTAPAKATAPAS